MVLKLSCLSYLFNLFFLQTSVSIQEQTPENIMQLSMCSLLVRDNEQILAKEKSPVIDIERSVLVWTLNTRLPMVEAPVCAKLTCTFCTARHLAVERNLSGFSVSMDFELL